MASVSYLSFIAVPLALVSVDFPGLAVPIDILLLLQVYLILGSLLFLFFKEPRRCPHPVVTSDTDLSDFSIKIPGELLGGKKIVSTGNP